jgi:pilus assembly protein CpaB
MNIRTLITLAIAVLLGLIAVVLVRGYLNSARKGPAHAVASTGVPVVVAAMPIPRGASLQPNLVKIVNFPAESVPAAAFHTVADVAGAQHARLALRSISPSEPVLSSEVSGPGGKFTLSSTLTEGMRAVALRANEVSGVGGFVLPGDHVDILLTRAVGNAAAVSTVTQVLAENVRVVGVDQSDDEGANKPVVARAVTVEVSPAQASAISLGQAVGSVSLSLRQVADGAPLAHKAITSAELGYAPKPPPPPGVRSALRLPRGQSEIRVTRGVETTSYAVPHI